MSQPERFYVEAVRPAVGAPGGHSPRGEAPPPGDTPPPTEGIRRLQGRELGRGELETYGQVEWQGDDRAVLRAGGMTFSLRLRAGRGPDVRRASPFLGAASGLLATLPMTLAMELLHRRLPARQRSPLPPWWITRRTLGRAGLGDGLRLSGYPAVWQWTPATLAGHFAYGAAAGALYAPLARAVRLPALPGGIGFGLLVWLASYLGWLPVAGLFPPATEQPKERNLLMVGAHALWGAVLGLLVTRGYTGTGTAPLPAARLPR